MSEQLDLLLQDDEVKLAMATKLLLEVRDMDKSTWSIETVVAVQKLAKEAAKIATDIRLGALCNLGLVLREIESNLSAAAGAAPAPTQPSSASPATSSTERWPMLRGASNDITATARDVTERLQLELVDCGERHLAERVALPIVGAVLGHADPKTTARYAHVDTASLARDPRLHLSFSAPAGSLSRMDGHEMATPSSAVAE